MERRVSLEQRTERLVQRKWESSPARRAPRDPNLLPRSFSVLPDYKCSPDPQMPPQAPKYVPVVSLSPGFPRSASGTPNYPTRCQVAPRPPSPPIRAPRSPSDSSRVHQPRWGAVRDQHFRGPRPSPNPLLPPSQALLRPRPCGPERAEPLSGLAPYSSILDDPLVQWRLRRCRGEGPVLGTPPVGRALLSSAAHQGARQGAPPGRSRDALGALQGMVPQESRDPPEAPWPIRRYFYKHQGASSPQAISQEPLWQEQCWRSHDSHKALWPVRSSSLDTLQGALYSQSGDSREAPWQISSSCCESVHQGAPKCGKGESHQPLQQEPSWGSYDCLWALRCAPYWKSRDSQDALQPAREALPESLCRGGPGLRSCDPCENRQPIRSSDHGGLQGAPLQQPLGPLGDPLLWMLRCHRRAIRGRLRAIETLLECTPGHP